VGQKGRFDVSTVIKLTNFAFKLKLMRLPEMGEWERGSDSQPITEHKMPTQLWRQIKNPKISKRIKAQSTSWISKVSKGRDSRCLPKY